MKTKQHEGVVRTSLAIDEPTYRRSISAEARYAIRLHLGTEEAA